MIDGRCGLHVSQPPCNILRLEHIRCFQKSTVNNSQISQKNQCCSNSQLVVNSCSLQSTMWFVVNFVICCQLLDHAVNFALCGQRCNMQSTLVACSQLLRHAVNSVACGQLWSFGQLLQPTVNSFSLRSTLVVCGQLCGLVKSLSTVNSSSFSPHMWLSKRPQKDEENHFVEKMRCHIIYIYQSNGGKLTRGTHLSMSWANLVPQKQLFILIFLG